jgi:hypothetical protein
MVYLLLNAGLAWPEVMRPEMMVVPSPRFAILAGCHWLGAFNYSLRQILPTLLRIKATLPFSRDQMRSVGCAFVDQWRDLARASEVRLELFSFLGTRLYPSR